MLQSAEIFAACAVVLGVFFLTLSPSIAGGDSGEIVAEGCHLGIAHPPGYPLMTIIIWFISKYIHIGTVAYRINGFCAICTALACYFVGSTANSLSMFSTGGGNVLALGLFGFSPLIWQYAVTAEVFPLNTMFAALLIYLVVQFSLHRDTRLPLVGALVCGLALCNQHTIVLYEAPLILWMLFLVRNHIHKYPLYFLQLSGSFILGVMPYLYLPLSAVFNPRPGSWGHVSTIEGLLHHVLRRDYGTFQLFSGATGRNAEGFWTRCEAYVRDFSEEQGLGVAHVLAVLGVVASVVVTVSVAWKASTGSKKTNTVHSAAASTTPSKISKYKGNVKNMPRRTNTPSVTSQSTITTDTTDNTTNTTSTSLINASECQYTPIVLLIVQLVYFGVFHSLANLPLGDKLLFGVHQRFWMQPAVLSFVWVGVGYDVFAWSVVWVVDTAISSSSSKEVKRGSISGGGGGVSQVKVAAVAKSETSTSTDTTNNNNKTTLNTISLITSTLTHIIAFYLIYTQYTRSAPKMDYSDNYHFRNYATALLDPLPLNAVLIVNYDQQWTSVRYMQICEHHRPDVTTLQLSMMTYKWFERKRELYPHLVFPGTYHTFPNSPAIKKDGAFPLHAFLDANTPSHSLFLGGKINYPDEVLSARYDLVPVGLVSQFVPFANAPNGTVYLNNVLTEWNKVMQVLPRLPNVTKYGEDTWEWTIGRDFKDRVIDTAAYLLSSSLLTAGSDVQPLVDAVYWLESACLIEGEARAPSSLLKNAGLAHVHLIQNQLLRKSKVVKGVKVFLPPPSQDLFRTQSAMNWPDSSSADWKIWSSDRFVSLWGSFLTRPDAQKDSQYSTIKNMYETATKKAAAQ